MPDPIPIPDTVDDVNLFLVRTYEVDTIIISTLQMREQGN